jgi:hypothetical protein
MLSQNPFKKKKIRSEISGADFKWDISPQYTNGAKDENYRKLLRDVYRYDPSAHAFDRKRFEIPDK